MDNDTCLAAEQTQLIKQLPALPREYSETEAGKTYASLHHKQPRADLDRLISWTETDAKSLARLDERLKVADPAAVAKHKRALRRELDNLLRALMEACEGVTPIACDRVHGLKQTAADCRSSAEEAARAIADSASLDGIGSQTWRRLWEAARSYSMESCYPHARYPNLEEGARCVLCQQVLSKEARARMKRFNDYVQGRLEAAAAKAERARDVAIDGLPRLPTEKALKTACQAAGLHDESLVSQVQSVWDEIGRIVSVLSDVSLTTKPPGLKEADFPVIDKLKVLSGDLGAQATQLKKDALRFDGAKAQAARLEMEARWWTSRQAEAIGSEMKRLRQVERFERWKRATNTAPISTEAGKIAEELMTIAYVQRFNDELERLGAKHIRVELTRTRTVQGHPYHCIRLKGLQVRDVAPDDVLSEGEQRVVTLAAFLADVTGKAEALPLVFDDPISSLDQGYEERTAERLIVLSSQRQVIVFTHRLSFLGLMSEANPEIAHLRLEPWGAGEPGEIAPFGLKPKRELNKLRQERLARAARVNESGGYKAYYPLGKSICTDLRIVLERVVENVLLADVVQRHRRDVRTKDTLVKLTKITADDCRFIERLMTKYSRFEHSQSHELPVEVPPPSDIADDIDHILAWQAEFKKR